MSLLNYNDFLTESQMKRSTDFINEQLGIINEGGAETIQCMECGKHMKQIQYRHLHFSHKMTMEEYKEKYPNSKLVAESSKNFGDSNPMSNPINKQKHQESVSSDEYKNKMKILSTGRYPSEEIKRKMSENNAMNYETFRKKVSDGVKRSYENNHELKNLRRDAMIGREIYEHTKEKNYISGRWLRPEEKNEFSVYCEKVKQITDENFTKYFYQIPNGKRRGREYHLDHKFSTSAGYRLGLSEEVIGHYKNLEIVFHSINESKGAKCSITLDELFTEILQSDYPIETHKLFCGGAYGHISHPFEDIGLTMGDLQEMISSTVNGAFGPENFVQEKCVSGDTIVDLEKCGPVTIKELVENRYEDNVLSQNLIGEIEFVPVMDWINNGPTEEWLEIETEDGKVIRVTPNHRIFANSADIKAEELQVGDILSVANYVPSIA